MMFKSSQGDLNGFLDEGSQLHGELHFEQIFRIDGKLTGKVVSDGELIVGENGEVDGEIDVRRVYVSGRVRGRVNARERLEITSAGRVQADLSTPSLTIEAGAHFEGHCSMGAAARAGEARKDKLHKLPLAEPS